MVFVAARVVSSPSAVAARRVRPRGPPGLGEGGTGPGGVSGSGSQSRGGHGACELHGSPARAGSTWKTPARCEPGSLHCRRRGQGPELGKCS